MSFDNIGSPAAAVEDGSIAYTPFAPSPAAGEGITTIRIPTKDSVSAVAALCEQLSFLFPNSPHLFSDLLRPNSPLLLTDSCNSPLSSPRSSGTSDTVHQPPPSTRPQFLPPLSPAGSAPSSPPSTPSSHRRRAQPAEEEEVEEEEGSSSHPIIDRIGYYRGIVEASTHPYSSPSHPLYLLFAHSPAAQPPRHQELLFRSKTDSLIPRLEAEGMTRPPPPVSTPPPLVLALLPSLCPPSTSPVLPHIPLPSPTTASVATASLILLGGATRAAGRQLAQRALCAVLPAHRRQHLLLAPLPYVLLHSLLVAGAVPSCYLATALAAGACVAAGALFPLAVPAPLAAPQAAQAALRLADAALSLAAHLLAVGGVVALL
eukprot:GHVS01077798.1.p1 GENE.GHVS01077798.1~~GHVS01077798.1.p1  ORF type:complete len:374 (-),score=99.02 GHVS01077798.1:843-1964(-)